MKRSAAIVILVGLACLMPVRPVEGAPALKVLATTTTLAALAEPVFGAKVSTLVPIGASPEDYQPTPTDIATLHNADVLIENGAGLESWLARTIANAANPHLRIVVCTDGLTVVDANPHLWMNPAFARHYVAMIRDAFSAADSAHAPGYQARAQAFDARLVALEKRTQTKIDTIPRPNRAMIVFHNAWEYYNARFGLRTVGVIELSPGQEPSPIHLAQLVDAARAQHVRAIFAEPEYNPKLVQQVARSANIPNVAVLYDDSLPPSASEQGYIAMIDLDTDTIVKALR